MTQGFKPGDGLITNCKASQFPDVPGAIKSVIGDQMLIIVCDAGSLVFTVCDLTYLLFITALFTFGFANILHQVYLLYNQPWS